MLSATHYHDELDMYSHGSSNETATLSSAVAIQGRMLGSSRSVTSDFFRTRSDSASTANNAVGTKESAAGAETGAGANAGVLTGAVHVSTISSEQDIPVEDADGMDDGEYDVDSDDDPGASSEGGDVCDDGDEDDGAQSSTNEQDEDNGIDDEDECELWALVDAD